MTASRGATQVQAMPALLVGNNGPFPKQFGLLLFLFTSSDGFKKGNCRFPPAIDSLIILLFLLFQTTSLLLFFLVY